MVLNQIPEKSKCKLPLSFGIYSKEFMKCLHVELNSGSKRSLQNNTKIIYGIILYLDIYKAHTS